MWTTRVRNKTYILPNVIDKVGGGNLVSLSRPGPHGDSGNREDQHCVNNTDYTFHPGM